MKNKHFLIVMLVLALLLIVRVNVHGETLKDPAVWVIYSCPDGIHQVDFEKWKVDDNSFTSILIPNYCKINNVIAFDGYSYDKRNILDMTRITVIKNKVDKPWFWQYN